MINIESLVEHRINQPWSEFKDEDYCQFSPHSIAEVPDSGIIFNGLNPSMTKKVRLKLIEKNDIACEFQTLTYDPNN